MKYYVIAGEASGDLHASHLIAALRANDAQAEFRGIGGDLMAEAGLTLLKHYRELAFMGFIPVLLHLRTILQGMARCRKDIAAWQPHVVILVDYPGFNLSMARYVHEKLGIPVYYYIAPKIWAWKEHRIHAIRRDVDELFSILPFEVDFFEKKHRYPIHYVGNPTVDEVTHYLHTHAHRPLAFRQENGLDERPIVALLAGSRKQEIRDNLCRMVDACDRIAHSHQLVLAGAPSIAPEFYQRVLGERLPRVKILFGQTYPILQHAEAALVTSGTATLETALFRVPQVVCYHVGCGKLVSWLRKRLLKVPYISLVNLICDSEVVPELVADGMTVARVREALHGLLSGGDCREVQLRHYRELERRLGEAGAPQRAAALMLDMLQAKVAQKQA